MSNPGFDPYMALSVAAKAGGGPVKYMLRVRGTSLAAGAIVGAATVAGVEYARDPETRAAKAWRCRVRKTHRPVRKIMGVDWDNVGPFGIMGHVTESHRECRDCGAPCPG